MLQFATVFDIMYDDVAGREVVLMNVLKHIPFKTSLLFLIILILLNIFYYSHSKELLVHNQKEQMTLLFNNIKSNIEQTAAGEKFVEDLIGQNLRTAAISAKMRLSPDINQIDNNDLVELKKIIGVDEITLFVKSGDDIIGAKSSDPKEINVSAKGWDTIFVVFRQMLNLEDVNVGMGQTLPNFWSGPIDTATTSPDELNKWGYYYDGTTNYIINPFVHDTNFHKYQQITGIEDAIKKLIKDNPETALEVSVLNSDKFLERKLPAINPAPSNWFSEREILFGTYHYRDPEDKKYAERALTMDQTVFYQTDVQGKSITKSFTPIHIDNLKYSAYGSIPLIQIASDNTEINNILNKQLWQTIWFMSLCTFVALTIMAAILWIFKRNKELALQDVQAAYVGNIETLFQSVREQRHDFINHIQTIHAFLTLKHYDALQNYTNDLVGEIRVVNELINIKDPALIALMQAKLTQAEALDILCEYDFKHMEQLNLSPIRATDIVKILSNLIDNAFDAVMEIEEKDRIVEVTGSVYNNQLQFLVRNKGPAIPPVLHGKMFESGFSTKPRGKNSGLGLHIVKQLVTRYKGTIQVKCENGSTAFIVLIPLLKTV
jgi:signal transduction histidine kinase